MNLIFEVEIVLMVLLLSEPGEWPAAKGWTFIILLYCFDCQTQDKVEVKLVMYD